MALLRRVQPPVAAAMVLVVAGCGFLDFEEADPWRGEEVAACFASDEVVESAWIELVDDIEGRGACGIERPLNVSALVDGTITLGPSAPLNCPMTARLQRWLRDDIQPYAFARFGAPVTTLNNFGSYNCRTRNNRHGAALSEHSYGNAFDVSGFTLADGRRVSVKDDWRGDATAAAFLREALYTACQRFRTVLGPGSDGAHEDHFHLDLLRHDASGARSYCRPVPALPPPAVSPILPPHDGVPMASAPPPSHPFSVEQMTAAVAAAQVAGPAPVGAFPDPAAYGGAGFAPPAMQPGLAPGPMVLGQVPAQAPAYMPPAQTFAPGPIPPGSIPMSFAPVR
jgi:hypothetical protein